MTKQTLLKYATGISLVGSMLLPSISIAQSTTTATTTTTTTVQIQSITALLQQIQALQAQISALQQSQVGLQTQVATQFNTFLTDLSVGSRGDAVLALQALLAANPGIYPEGLITGYFGPATERALKKLQQQNGIEQAGRVGPKTRVLLNRLLRDNPVGIESATNATSTTAGKRVCAKVPPGKLIAPGWLKKNDGVRPIVPECQTLPPGIQVKIDGNWKPGTTTPTTPPATTTATTTPDTTAPVVQNLVASSTLATRVLVTWTTNENATSTLWYSSTTPIVLDSATQLSNDTWKTSHSYQIDELTATTTYYFMLKVSDTSGNSFTTTEQSVMTGQ